MVWTMRVEQIDKNAKYLVTDEGMLFKWIVAFQYYQQQQGNWMYKTKGRNPYIMYSLRAPSSGQNRIILAHRLVANTFIERPDGTTEVNHIDGNPSNNHYKNLEWVTHHENMLHAQRTGLKTDIHMRGENNRAAKITLVDAINIRHCRGSITSEKLADYYPISGGAIRNIWAKKVWNKEIERTFI